MIQLTRLNNARLALNSDLIKYVEQAPDTVITLLSGEKLVVRETTDQVIERVLEFRRAIMGTLTNFRRPANGDEVTASQPFSDASLSKAEAGRG